MLYIMNIKLFENMICIKNDNIGWNLNLLNYECRIMNELNWVEEIITFMLLPIFKFFDNSHDFRSNGGLKV